MATAALSKLVAAVPVSDEDLRALARRRAECVRDMLVIRHGVAGERVFLQEANIQVTPKDGVVNMELALEGK